MEPTEAPLFYAEKGVGFMANSQLHVAKTAKNDEFYTQYEDIEAEMNAYVEYNKDVFRGKTILCPCDDPNRSAFTEYFLEKIRRNTLGIRKIICTSYAKSYLTQNPTETEKASSSFDAEKHYTHGRIFVIDESMDLPKNVRELPWEYLKGDGDFRSEEVTKLRDEADIIITNPPFSLFREFLAWIIDAEKQFIIIGNQNAITYKEVFPLIKNNHIWLGSNTGGSRKGNSMLFIVPLNYENQYVEEKNGKHLMQTSGKWFTNIDHGKRHEPLQLMTMADNLKYNKKLRKKLEKDYGKIEYPHYDNYDAIEVPMTEAIPSDYDGVMGVPITFLDKYCPEQFEIVAFRKGDDGKDLVFTREREKEFNNAFASMDCKKKRVQPYFRILVRQVSRV